VFADVDAIIHAGDMLHPEVDMAFAPCTFYAVRGNMDTASAHTPLKRILEFSNVHIGVIHGWGVGAGIEYNAASEFDLQSIHILIYGHSHSPACHMRDGVLFFNPGSAAERRRAPFHSVGLIRIGLPDCGAAAGDVSHPEKDEHTEPEDTCPVAARQILYPGTPQQVIAEIINIDAIPEIV
jgi:hypothetical protein